ncbi:MAG: hypothetical protein H0X24_00465 [Ktedonobacterales bacterium]|nr:hypothetical protein [Ktedonobacterales bacterium]
MIRYLLLGVLLAATGLSGLLAGISLDKAVVQLPARHQLGALAYAAYIRAADLQGGLRWYPLLGVGAPLLVVAAVALLPFAGFPRSVIIPIFVAAGLSGAHLVTTSRAAPLLLQLRHHDLDEATLQEVFRRFARWHGRRCIVQLATFGVLLWALFVLAA